MADLSCNCTNRKHSCFATKLFQRKSLKIFDPSSAAEKVSIVCGTNNHVKSEMLSKRHTDRQTNKPSTLAVHVRRGLIIFGCSIN